MSKAEVTEIEEAYVLDALRSGWVAPLGPHVDAFEAELAERVGVAHALALSSGTAALHLALLGVGAGPGTVVMCPTMTFAATANAIVYTGARPVFIDAEISDGNVDAVLLLQTLDTLRTEGVEVPAVVVVDLFGRCADYDTLVPGLAARGVALIEDAAESLGASQHGRAAGAFGRAGVLSFNGNKIMTTSGGGMLLSDDGNLIERARYLATQARQPVGWYEHRDIGYNYRLSNILAALGRGQLARLDAMIARRRDLRWRYLAQLADIPGVRFLTGREPDAQENFWLTCLTLDENKTGGVSAQAVIAALAAQNIEARPLWKPMHRQPVFAGERAALTGVADALFATGLTLPSGSGLSDDDVARVISVVRGALRAAP